jgi:hypothetical protein
MLAHACDPPRNAQKACNRAQVAKVRAKVVAN